MPTVKTYQRQITTERAPTVRREGYAIPHLETPAPAVPQTGGPEGMARFGEAAAQIGEQLYAAEQKKQDQIRLLDADRQAGDLENNLMYDPKTGALNVRGKDALGLIDTVGKQWDDATGKIRQGLSNDRQRIAFDQYNVAKRRSLIDRLNQHIAKETYRVDGEALEGKVENETEAAIADGRPERINQALDSIRQSYTDYGQRYGMSPEQTQAATATAVSRIHVGVIHRMLDNGNDIQAKVYYEHAEGEVLGKDRGELERSLHEGNVRGDSQRIADTIVNKAGTDYTLSGLVDEVAKKTSDPEIRDRAEQRIHAWYERAKEDDRVQTEKRNQTIREQLEAEKQKKEEEKKQREQLVGVTVPNLIDQGKPQDVHTFLDKVSPGLWQQATLKEREEWERYAKREEKGEKVKTDFGTYYDLLSRSSSPKTRDDFAKTNLNDPQLLNRISESDLKHLAEIQAAIRKGDDKKTTELTDTFRTMNARIAQSLRGLKLDPDAKKGTDDYTRKLNLQRAVEIDVADFESREKRKPKPDEIQGMIDLHVIQSTFPPAHFWNFSGEQRMEIDVPPGESFPVTIKDIPPAIAQKLESALVRKMVREGQPPEISEQMIVDAYRATVHRLPRMR